MVYRPSKGVSLDSSGDCPPDRACRDCRARNGFQRALEQPDDAPNDPGLAKGLSKAEARSGVRRLQQFFGLAFLFSAASGVYLLATDGSLWHLAISHAVGLVVIVAIDGVLAIMNLRLRRKIFLPSLAAALLGFMLQLADILTAPQYNMTMQYFAAYLFGLWAFDLLLALQFAIIAIGVAGRGYVRELARRQKTKRARELGYSRRGFLKAIVSFAGMIGVVVTLGSIKLPPPSPPSSQTTQAARSAQNAQVAHSSPLVKPTGAIANTTDLVVGSPVYFEYPKGYPSMLMKKADGALVALSMLCTHVCCECTYEPSNSVIFCPCHGSVFDTTGSVLRGPAGSPLPAVALTIDSSGYIFPSGIRGFSPCVR